jgi:hypothetical protein
MPQKQVTINTVQAGLKRLESARFASEAAYLDIMGVKVVALADGLAPEHVPGLETKLAAVKAANDALRVANLALIAHINSLPLAPPGAAQTGC